MAQETPKQKAERLARIKQLKSQTSRINNVGKDLDPAPKARKSNHRGAGPPPAPQKTDTSDFIEKHLSKIPSSPWSLYGHFCAVVRANFPEAVLPQAGNGKYLRWGKQLLKDYTPEKLFEMTRVHVMDYENINKSRVFFKYGGTPTPTFEQFFSNAEMLATYIGKGVTAIPSARISGYYNDYVKRNGLQNNISNETEDQGKTDTEQANALREQIKRGGMNG